MTFNLKDFYLEIDDNLKEVVLRLKDGTLEPWYVLAINESGRLYFYSSLPHNLLQVDDRGISILHGMMQNKP